MSEEDTILPSVQTNMALDAKIHAHFKNKNWYIYCGSSRHRKCFQPFRTDCTQYHISVKCPTVHRWLLLRDPDILIWYDDISCNFFTEFGGYQNCHHFCWPKLGLMITCQYSYLRNRG